MRTSPAQRALEALGLHREGVLRSHLRRPDGTMRDTVYYSVLATVAIGEGAVDRNVPDSDSGVRSSGGTGKPGEPLQ